MTTQQQVQRSLTALVCGMLLFAGPSGQAKEWPRFRGPNGSGISLAKGIPSKFTVADAKWRVALKGEGHSSPVLWGDLVYVTTAEKTGSKKPFSGPTPEGAHNNMDPESDYHFAVLAIERQTGVLVWRRTVAMMQPHESTQSVAF